MHGFVRTFLFRSILLLVCVLLLAGCAPFTLKAQPFATASPGHQGTGSPGASQAPDSTPKYTPFAPLLAQVVAVGPVYVTGDRSVPPEALRDAGAILEIMLQHRPDIS